MIIISNARLIWRGRLKERKYQILIAALCAVSILLSALLLMPQAKGIRATDIPLSVFKSVLARQKKSAAVSTTLSELKGDVFIKAEAPPVRVKTAARNPGFPYLLRVTFFPSDTKVSIEIKGGATFSNLTAGQAFMGGKLKVIKVHAAQKYAVVSDSYGNVKTVYQRYIHH